MILSTEHLTSSDKNWAKSTSESLDTFLPEAADCERKASSTALFFTSKYPKYERVMEGFTTIAINNLKNFGKLQKAIREKNLVMQKEINKNLYLSSLIGFCRGKKEERFLDRIIVAAASELRAAERYQLLEKHLNNSTNKLFQELASKKQEHANDYIQQALKYFDGDEVKERTDELLRLEHEILRSHSSHPTLF